jgi:hypothetical protein
MSEKTIIDSFLSFEIVEKSKSSGDSRDSQTDAETRTDNEVENGDESPKYLKPPVVDRVPSNDSSLKFDYPSTTKTDDIRDSQILYQHEPLNSNAETFPRQSQVSGFSSETFGLRGLGRYNDEQLSASGKFQSESIRRRSSGVSQYFSSHYHVSILL